MATQAAPPPAVFWSGRRSPPAWRCSHVTPRFRPPLPLPLLWGRPTAARVIVWSPTVVVGSSYARPSCVTVGSPHGPNVIVLSYGYPIPPPCYCRVDPHHCRVTLPCCVIVGPPHVPPRYCRDGPRPSWCYCRVIFPTCVIVGSSRGPYIIVRLPHVIVGSYPPPVSL